MNAHDTIWALWDRESNNLIAEFDTFHELAWAFIWEMIYYPLGDEGLIWMRM